MLLEDKAASYLGETTNRLIFRYEGDEATGSVTETVASYQKEVIKQMTRDR
jgi:hypothetical protein